MSDKEVLIQILFADGYRLFTAKKYNKSHKHMSGYYVAEYSGKQFIMFSGSYQTKQQAFDHITKICKANNKAMFVEITDCDKN